jgi:phage tail tape-measure protein
MGGGTTTTLRTAKDIAGDIRNTHMVTTGVAKAATAGKDVLSKVDALAPVLGKVTPLAEKALPVLEKAAIPVAVGVGVVTSAWQFSKGDNRGASKTLGQTGGAIAGALGGAEGGAAIGTLICPGLGTAIGGGIGGIAGGFAGSAAGKWVGGWIHDRVVDVKHAFNSSASGTSRAAPVHKPATPVRTLAPAH